MQRKRLVLDGKHYWLHEKSFTPWVVLVAADGNEQAYDSVFRTSGDENGEIDIFSLIPAEDSGDTLLLQIRMCTQADWNADKEGVANPVISTECYIPVAVQIDPQHKRILLTLLCRIQAIPGHLIVTPHPDAGLRFAARRRAV